VRFISEGGYLDLFVFAQDMKTQVDSFGRLTGRPFVPPLFGMGYHQSKYGYMSQKEVMGVMENMTRYDIPYDVIVLDINHLRDMAAFEFDPVTFPRPREMFKILREQNRYMVRISDCHLPDSPEHIQFQEAKGRYFIRRRNGEDFFGKVWPKEQVAFVDFFNETVFKWYSSKFHYGEGRDITDPIVHFWNDMGEPMIFGPVADQTFPKDARHLNGLECRETHGVYGTFQGHATHIGTIERNHPPHERAWNLILSFFAGAQKWAWSWTGDNFPLFDSMWRSVGMVAVAGLNGFPFYGEDVGGHMNPLPTSELLIRWLQLGAWVYPFYRQHCSIVSPRREPWLWPKKSMERQIKAIKSRYAMIGVWYTHAIYCTRTSRSPVVPLWYEWPEVEDFHTNEVSVLLGDALLVAPVMESGATFVEVAKPPGVWYDFFTGRVFKESGKVPVTIDDIPVFIRGGRIVPKYEHPVHCAIETILTPLTLYVALENGEAEGSLYLDDGITFNYTLGVFCHRRFKYADGKLTWYKAEEGEKSVPDILRSAIVESIVIYDHEVKKFTGLKLLVVDEWIWTRPKEDEGLDSR
jgi:alpha 1,3-glucosidase